MRNLMVGDKGPNFIRLQNTNGETCHHIAIPQNMDVVQYLIDKADSRTFVQIRCLGDNR